MERAWSVEDLVGGLWRMGERTSSEQQIQDYLRRVPSGSWPAASPGQQPSPEQFQQSVQAQAAALAAAQAPHAQAQAQAAYAAQAAGMQQAMQAMAAGKAGELVQGQARAGGQNPMQRVASLDMLRALVMQGQAPPGAVAGGMPSASAMTAPPNRPPGRQPVAPGAMANGLAHAAGGVKVDPAAVAAAGLVDPTKGLQDKSEIRRVRRMLSNRESARRSRRRKQEHLQTLEDKIKNSELARTELEGQLSEISKENQDLKAECERLRRENAALRSGCFTELPTPAAPQLGAAAAHDATNGTANGTTNGEAAPREDSAQTKSRSPTPDTANGDARTDEEAARGEKRPSSETLKRNASIDELSKRFKGDGDAGNCTGTLQNAHRESWQDLTAAEKVH